jgi:two-component system OmpR family response regulator
MNAIMRAMDLATRILIVDDDPGIRNLMSSFLDKHGYHTDTACDPFEMRELLAQHRFDLIVLDVMMPREDGLTALRDLQRDDAPPVIMLSAVGTDVDRIVGLEMGADDYVLKPFSPRELIARIKVILRRAGNGGARLRPPESESYAFAGWVLKAGERTLVDSDGVSVPLSTGEYNLLLALVSRPNQVLSRDQLLDITQGREANPFDRAIDNQISRLRRKVEPDHRNPTLIKTVWGGGYTLAADVTRM